MKSRQEKHDFLERLLTNQSLKLKKKVQLISSSINNTQHEINIIQENIDKSQIGIKLLQLYDQIQINEQTLKLAIEEKKEGLQALAQESLNIHKSEYKILEEQLTKLDNQLNGSKKLLEELDQQLKEVLQSAVNIKPL